MSAPPCAELLLATIGKCGFAELGTGASGMDEQYETKGMPKPELWRMSQFVEPQG